MSVAIAVVLMVTVAITGFSTSTFAQQQKFMAKLTGSEEVPPNTTTKATGNAEFTLSTDGKKLEYKVNVMNLDKVTAAHIHTGKTGENGPVVATLFKSGTLSVVISGPMNGILSQGSITSDKLEGPLAGKQISDLVKMITEGNTYANVHTETNPKGEIRGQITNVTS
jgi:hypothetical protein